MPDKKAAPQIQFLVRPAQYSSPGQEFDYAAWTGSHLLYWGKRIDTRQLAYDKTKKTITNTINLVLILVAIIGIVAFAWSLYLMQQQGDPAWNFYKVKGLLMLIFWFSLILDTYLFYRIQTEFESFKHITKRKYQLTPPRFQPIDWSDISKISPDNIIDVSQYYTSQALEAAKKAWQLSNRYRNAQTRPLHLLIALLTYNQTNIVLSRLGVSYKSLKTRLSTALVALKPLQGRTSEITLEFKRVLLEAYFLSWQLRNDKVDVTELLEALSIEFTGNEVFEIFYDLNIDQDKVANVASWIRIRKELSLRWQRFRGKATLRPKGYMDRAMTAIATPVLNAFSQDLTLLARGGYLLPCIGRENEIQQIFQVMHGGTRRSVVLIGQPGVGKQTIIEGIAQMMVEENVPAFLQDKRLVSLDVAKLVSGVPPAVAQERLLAILSETKRSGNIALVIKDIGGIVGISSGEKGSLDLAGTLAQVLSDNSILTIASSTPNDYRRSIENKSALENSFEVIQVKEVSGNQAIQVLEAKAGGIEYQNKVYFSYDSIAATVELSDRYLHDRYLPEKAIEILQEVASYVREQKGENAVVAKNDVAYVLSAKTNIPLTELTQEESQKLLTLEDQIHQRVIGQEEAVKMVAASLRRARAEMREMSRPIVNLLFLGPTGVGKTELAKTIAEVYFKAEKNMIRIDMSEYQDKASVNRLIGAPPGYGNDEGGQLTEAVRKNPFSLVLFDEIEKAHPDVLNLLLQIMDDGRLTDSSGRTVDFTNTIIIGTSNAGTKFIQDSIKAGKQVETVKQELMDNYLQQYFKPEFLNRFDGIIVFKPLAIDDVKEIAKLMLKKVAENLEERGVELEVTPEGLDALAKLGYSPEFGARPLRRVIQDKVRDVLANYLISNKIQRRDLVEIGPALKMTIKKARPL